MKALPFMTRRPAHPAPHPGQPGAVSRGGGAGGFEVSVLCHLDAAYTLAMYLTRRPDVAEDIVQDALLRAYRSFHTCHSGNARAWLLAIVRNCFFTWAAGRRENREIDRAEGLDGASDAACEVFQEQHTPEASLLKKEQDLAVTAIVESLPEQFREVLVLKDIEDLSYREIAEVIGAPIGTVMSRLSRARGLFATAWKDKEAAASKGVRS
jgi:RNA polymerase sigma factor (sigma-70 family)